MKHIPLTILIAEASHSSGNQVLFPVQMPDMVRTNMSAQSVAQEVYQMIHADLLMKGLYDRLWTYVSQTEPVHELVTVTLEASKEHLFGTLELTFDLYYVATEARHLVGFVPVLSLESTGNTLDELREHTVENIRLEFMRKKRLQSVPSILTTQWFSNLTIHSIPIEFTFYTLSEQEKMQHRQKEEILPQVAQRMIAGGDQLFGLANELEGLTTALQTRSRNSVVVIGEVGKGKTTIIREFARRKDKLGLKDVHIWEVSAAQLLHRLSGLGGWEEHLAYVCNELRKRGDILYVQNLAELFEVGQYSGNSQSMADYLRDYLARGEITLLAECTPEEVALIELRSPGYLALLTQIRLETLTQAQIQAIVLQKMAWIYQKKPCLVEETASLEILRLQHWYTPYSGLPGKTLRFLETLIADKHKQQLSTVTKADIYEKFCQETGMPEFMINPEAPLDVEAMHQFFYKNIYGQKEAIQTVLDMLVSVKAAVIRRGKPLASLLFVGPTGVGKTEMAKVLAGFMFGNRNKMLRFDMSEYADFQAVLRLTGDLHSGEGLLTAAVRQDPFSVVLFDELEKVHTSFYDLLLQILGEGRLTDAKGRVADFCSTIIIMTSNIGARTYQTGNIGFVETQHHAATATEHFMTEVQNHFRPELFNRIDRILAFVPLEKAIVRQIVDREIELVRKREGIRSRNLKLSIERDVLDFLGTEGYNWAYGARFLQRTIHDKFIVPLSAHLNRHSFVTPLDVVVGMNEKELAFQIQKRNEIPLTERDIEGAKSLTVAAFTTQVSEQRRQVMTIQHGNYYARFLSRFDQLERKRRRLESKNKEDEFWKDEVTHKLYYELQELREDFRAAFEQIHELDMENFLVLNGLGPDVAKLYAQFRDWYVLFKQLKVRLVQLENPELMQCVWCIYGNASALKRVADLYVALLSDEKAYTFRAYQVWHNSQAIVFTEESWKKFKPYNPYTDYKKPVTYLRMPYESVVDESYTWIGVEMEVSGNLSFIYLKGESGVHQWLTSDGKTQRYKLSVSAQSFEKFKTPSGIHRKSLFGEKEEPRRFYTAKGLTDTDYNLSSDATAMVSELQKVLQKKFEEAINTYLLDT